MLFTSPAKVSWNGFTYTLTQFKAMGQCGHCREAEPKLDASYRPQATSAAVAASIEHPAYAAFQTRYGLNIRRDITGRVRPLGAKWEIGAFEVFEL
jgi:hypothetical protein